jgi:hypothetical protein
MDRVLGLQALTEFGESEPPDGGCSGTSNVCSSSSGGTGDSGCSVQCGSSDELEW